GGTYLLSTMHATTLRVYGSYKDGGWRPKITYFEDKPVPYTDEWGMTWTLGSKKLVAPTIEFGHRFETIVNGMAAAGMVVDGIWEFSPGDDDETEPGSDAHLDTLFPAFIEVRGRKLLPGAWPIDGQRAPQPLRRRKVLHGLADGDTGGAGGAWQQPGKDRVRLGLAGLAQHPADRFADEELTLLEHPLGVTCKAAKVA